MGEESEDIKEKDELAFPDLSLAEYHPGQWLIHTYKNRSHEVHFLVKVLSIEKHRVTVRGRDRKISVLDTDAAFLKPADQADDDMNSPFEYRRTWFDLLPEYRKVPLHFCSYSKKSNPWYFTCPCCGYPSMSVEGPLFDDTGDYYYEICPLCEWADQYGQDDHNADKVNKGANWDYALSEARKNFDQVGSMFRPNEKNELRDLTHRALFDIGKGIRSKFDAMVGETRPGKIYLLWCEIKRRWRKLDIQLQKRESMFHIQSLLSR